jgi:hypothetical protein
MANKNPSSNVTALFDRSIGSLGRTSSTVDQVTAGALASLAGASGSSGGSAGSSSALSDQLLTITDQLRQLQTVNQTQVETMQQNTQALSQSGSTGQGGVASTVGGIGSTLQTVLGFGLGLSPLISSLVGLFGGGGSSAPAAPVPFTLPLPVKANAGISASSPGGAFGVDNADGGLPRPVPAPSTQITVQVQALDSQSFLDHSNDIAQAVRQAMLETSVLNDVIREV